MMKMMPMMRVLTLKMMTGEVAEAGEAAAAEEGEVAVEEVEEGEAAGAGEGEGEVAAEEGTKAKTMTKKGSKDVMRKRGVTTGEEQSKTAILLQIRRDTLEKMTPKTLKLNHVSFWLLQFRTHNNCSVIATSSEEHRDNEDGAKSISLKGIPGSDGTVRGDCDNNDAASASSDHTLVDDEEDLEDDQPEEEIIYKIGDAV